VADRVRIFDTTLRDGEQSPGAAMTSAEKIEVARALARLGVDVIEAGFPAASPDDLAAVRAIAEEVGRGPNAPIVCGLARAHVGDIDAAWTAVKGADRPRIHTFLATSDVHLEHKLRLTRHEAVARVAQMVGYARSLCPDVEFSAEDATRSDPRFLHEVAAVAIAAGATTINLPDTVGYTTPDELGALIAGIREHVPGAKDVVLSVHCHDDLGLATANTLAGLAAGARQAEVTVNGIGERAGNCSLEEVVMALATRRGRFGLSTGIDTTQLCRASRLVSARSGMVVAPNKAVVGGNAFAHESGIHQDGMLKNAQTYEIMRPEDVGAGDTRLVLGKHSGRAGFMARLETLGYTLSGAELDEAFARFKVLADKKKRIYDEDLEQLIGERAEGGLALEGLQVASGTVGLPTATVRLRVAERTVVRAAVGAGPIDAVCRAIDEALGRETELVEYVVHAVTPGIDALGEVSVRVRAEDGRLAHGHGTDIDVIVASAKAYLSALGRLPLGAPAAETAHGGAV
jgi:2-isopropylmalate synthase